MKKKFDFVIEDDKGYTKTIFRFYPRRTHVHGFGDEPPADWHTVYKTYYSWAIILQYYNDDETAIEPESSTKLLDMYCDECSMIPNLSSIIKNVIETGEKFDKPTIGQPAGDWIIEKTKYFNFREDKELPYINFMVFDNYFGNGFRFTFDEDKALEFCDYLDKINQYALEHGEGI